MYLIFFLLNVFMILYLTYLIVLTTKTREGFVPIMLYKFYETPKCNQFVKTALYWKEFS